MKLIELRMALEAMWKRGWAQYAGLPRDAVAIESLMGDVQKLEMKEGVCEFLMALAGHTHISTK